MESPEMNPFESLRLATGNERTAFAAALGIPYSQLYALEKGAPEVPPERVLAQLESLGYDTTDLVNRYTDWRQRHIDAVRESIREQAPA